jgi:hypothetical protein
VFAFKINNQKKKKIDISKKKIMNRRKDLLTRNTGLQLKLLLKLHRTRTEGFGKKTKTEKKMNKTIILRKKNYQDNICCASSFERNTFQVEILVLYFTTTNSSENSNCLK